MSVIFRKSTTRSCDFHPVPPVCARGLAAARTAFSSFHWLPLRGGESGRGERIGSACLRSRTRCGSNCVLILSLAPPEGGRGVVGAKGLALPVYTRGLVAARTAFSAFHWLPLRGEKVVGAKGLALPVCARGLAAARTAFSSFHWLPLRGEKVVGAKGFEPSASWSQTRHSNQAELRPEPSVFTWAIDFSMPDQRRELTLAAIGASFK